jgi:TolB protein
VRSITWVPLAAAALIATLLVAWRHGHTGDAPLYLVAVLLPSATGFALDDHATELLAASPTSLLRRRLLRVLVVGPPVAVIWTVLLWWGYTHGPEETLGLMLIFTGLLGLSLGAAGLAGRRSGGRAGGIFTPPAILVMLFLSSVFPPRWRPLPMGDIPGGWPQIYIRWTAAAIVGTIVFLASSRDPAARVIRHWFGRRSAVATLTVAALGLTAVGVAQVLLGQRSTLGTDVGPRGRIAFMSLTRALTHRDTSDLFVLDVASGEVAPLHQGRGFSIVPQWSPDGSLIAFASNERGRGYGIFVAQADGSAPVNVLDEGSRLADPGPISLSWSPDGSRIAYTGRDPESGWTVWIMNTDGNGHRAVLEGHWEEVSWSPDGERLLLLGDPQTKGKIGQLDVYSVCLNGSGLVQLTDDELIERRPAWSPGGNRIVFAKRSAEFENPDYGQDIYVMDADGSALRRLTDWEGFDSFPVWSPDGRWIAFASDRDATIQQQRVSREGGPFGGISIYVMRADGSAVGLLARGSDVALLPASWASE